MSVCMSELYCMYNILDISAEAWLKIISSYEITGITFSYKLYITLELFSVMHKYFKEINTNMIYALLSLSWFSVCAACQCLNHFLVFSTLVTL
jgi:hypothetical protein